MEIIFAILQDSCSQATHSVENYQRHHHGRNPPMTGDMVQIAEIRETTIEDATIDLTEIPIEVTTVQEMEVDSTTTTIDKEEDSAIEVEELHLFSTISKNLSVFLQFSILKWWSQLIKTIPF